MKLSFSIPLLSFMFSWRFLTFLSFITLFVHQLVVLANYWSVCLWVRIMSCVFTSYNLACTECSINIHNLSLALFSPTWTHLVFLANTPHSPRKLFVTVAPATSSCSTFLHFVLLDPGSNGIESHYWSVFWNEHLPLFGFISLKCLFPSLSLTHTRHLCLCLHYWFWGSLGMRPLFVVFPFSTKS